MSPPPAPRSISDLELAAGRPADHPLGIVRCSSSEEMEAVLRSLPGPGGSLRTLPLLDPPSGPGWPLDAFSERWGATAPTLRAPEEPGWDLEAAGWGEALVLTPADGPARELAALLARATGAPLAVAPAQELARRLEKELAGRRAAVLVALHQDLGDEVLTRLVGLQEDALRGRGDLPWDRLPRVGVLTGRDPAALSWLLVKTLIAARAQLAWAEGSGATAARTLRLTRVRPGAASSGWEETPPGSTGSPGPQIQQDTTLEGPALVERLRQPGDLVMAATHGFEACANAGGGALFCGLQHEARRAGPDPSPTAGRLACGQGHGCPRGPFPVPVVELDWKALVLGSCNGLRLADSALDADFNLGLAFLEGRGVAYGSSLACNLGSDLAASAWSAALASGRSLGEAMLLANGAVGLTGVEAPGYVALGHPCLRLAPEGADGTGSPWLRQIRLERGETGRGPARSWAIEEVDGEGGSGAADTGREVYWLERPEPDGGAQLILYRFPEPLPAGLEIRPRNSAATFREGLERRSRNSAATFREGLERRSRNSAATFREGLEKQPRNSAATFQGTQSTGPDEACRNSAATISQDDPGPSQNSAATFSEERNGPRNSAATLPAGVVGGGLQAVVRAVDRQALVARARRAVAGLEGWLEMGRLGGWDSGELWQGLAEAAGECRQSVARILPRLAAGGTAPRLLGQHLALVEQLAEMVRDQVLEELLPQLDGTLWPANLFTPEALLTSTTETRCPACRTRARRKLLEHSLWPERPGSRQEMVVCPRCGIVQGRAADGAIRRLEVTAPQVVAAGETLPLEVHLVAAPGPPIRIEPRLSALGRHHLEPRCLEGEPLVSGSSEGAGDRDERLRFAFELPADLLPHRYFLKVIAASAEELAFASYTFFAVSRP